MVDSATISFNDNVIRIVAQSPYKQIVTSGILYPAAFTGDQSGSIIDKPLEPDSITVLGKLFFHRLDTIFIDIIQELKVNSNPTIKRFRLYLWHKGFANPSLYVFQLTNYNATRSTTLHDFINGSSLTFLKFITIII